MKRTALLSLGCLVALGTIGCNTQRLVTHSPGFAGKPVPRIPTYALAVTVHGGLQPTPAQWAAIQARVADELALKGAVLVTDIDLADRIIRVDFRPNPIDPDNGGHITVLGVRLNPYRGIARVSNPGPYRSTFASAYGFSGSHFSTLGWGLSDYYSGYHYNYLGPWENGYTDSGRVVNLPKPPSTTPPHRHRPKDPTQPELCPPDQLHARPTRFVSTDSSQRMTSGSDLTPAYTSPMPVMASASTNASMTTSRWTGERSAWRSELTANRPERFASRSDSSGSRSDRYARTESSSSSSRERSSWRDNSSSRSDNSWWSSRSSSYDSSSSSSSGSSGYMSAGSSHVTPSYTSPSPSYESSSSSSSSGSMSTSSSSSSSSSSSDSSPSNQNQN